MNDKKSAFDLETKKKLMAMMQAFLQQRNNYVRMEVTDEGVEHGEIAIIMKKKDYGVWEVIDADYAASPDSESLSVSEQLLLLEIHNDLWRALGEKWLLSSVEVDGDSSSITTCISNY